MESGGGVSQAGRAGRCCSCGRVARRGRAGWPRAGPQAALPPPPPPPPAPTPPPAPPRPRTVQLILDRRRLHKRGRVVQRHLPEAAQPLQRLVDGRVCGVGVGGRREGCSGGWQRRARRRGGGGRRAGRRRQHGRRRVPAAGAARAATPRRVRMCGAAGRRLRARPPPPRPRGARRAPPTWRQALQAVGVVGRRHGAAGAPAQL
jgi:hypothetical protein